MGVLLRGGKKRDWTKIASATVETIIKALAFGKAGFFPVIPPLLKVFEAARGEDNTQGKARRFVFEVTAFALAKAISTVDMQRTPLGTELTTIIDNILARVDALMDQQEVFLEASHVGNPGSFSIFEDTAGQLVHALKHNSLKVSDGEVIAAFKAALPEAINRVRTRNPDYYRTVFELLSSASATGDARSRAWERYRELLVRRFEDEPIFGEERVGGTTLGQIYQPLRGWWDSEDQEHILNSTKKPRSVKRTVSFLDKLILNWLDVDDFEDRIRLISGGPGSGKSTFAKYLAASLSSQLKWRVIFVPLQRIKGVGPLETRINDYLRLQADEPFDLETVPLNSLAQVGHRDWLIIFDGLDELAKEGPSSESAAQDFATALADWRGRLGNEVAMRFLVLGRAPSMQDARRRLGLEGKGTVHVAGMAPLSKIFHGSLKEVEFLDPHNFREVDQRPEFWSRWAIAKNLSQTPPEAMGADALLDLTNEPLLAYLLIMSGYVSERWEEAAENRNRIYQAIFDQIWERERAKPTRIHLNDLGKIGFEALLQSLGIAAWRGGGRTGDEATFISVRDVFMRPDLLSRAKSCGAAELNNVALLFYTRKDEEGGQGYEFLHKSFGEYLTARGLLDAFRRWADQVNDPTSDFDLTTFLRRWLKLSGPAPITREILTFLRNEVGLYCAENNTENPWEAARRYISVAEDIVDVALLNGLPAHENASRWRDAEAEAVNGEIAVFAVLDALARAAFPTKLFGQDMALGGWAPGPIKIPSTLAATEFTQFIRRVNSDREVGWMGNRRFFVRFPGSVVGQMMSRLDLREVGMTGMSLSGFDFEGCNFHGSRLAGCVFSHTSFQNARFSDAHLDYSRFFDVNFSGAELSGAQFHRTYLDAPSLINATLSSNEQKLLAKAQKAIDREADIGVDFIVK